MAVYPPTLRQGHLIGVSQTQDDQVLRTTTESGISKTRRRFTGVAKKVTTRLIFDSTEMSTFLTFFNTTIKGGAESFEWTEPLTGDTVECRSLKFPNFRSVTPDLYQGDWELEILP